MVKELKSALKIKGQTLEFYGLMLVENFILQIRQERITLLVGRDNYHFFFTQSFSLVSPYMLPVNEIKMAQCPAASTNPLFPSGAVAEV
ncbi:hypothetical protein DWZ86_08260 [Clostridiales bacterium AF36-10]|jgi:hypothetical protein|nr:hypothetical protein DWZ86_08260 [Clostridiales bacterium AF36-10]